MNLSWGCRWVSVTPRARQSSFSMGLLAGHIGFRSLAGHRDMPQPPWTPKLELGCSMGGGRRRQLAPPVKMTGISCNPSATHAPQRAPPAGHDTVGLLVLVPDERRSRNYGAAMCRSRRSRRDAEKSCVAAMRRPQRRPPQEALRFARRRRGWLNRRRR